MINNKTLIIFCIFCLSLSSCTSVKNALTGKKSDNSDEFLIIKKNPLVMPPDYDELPEPKLLSDKCLLPHFFSISLSARTPAP